MDLHLQSYMIKCMLVKIIQKMLMNKNSFIINGFWIVIIYFLNLFCIFKTIIKCLFINLKKLQKTNIYINN